MKKYNGKTRKLLSIILCMSMLLGNLSPAFAAATEPAESELRNLLGLDESVEITMDGGENELGTGRDDQEMTTTGPATEDKPEEVTTGPAAEEQYPEEITTGPAAEDKPEEITTGPAAEEQYPEEITTGPAAEDLEPELFCGLEEHEHDDDCYEMFKVLICGLEEGEEDEEGYPHEHSEDCFEDIEYLICDEDEHTHTSYCYDEDYEDPEEYDEDPDKDTFCGRHEHEHKYNCLTRVETDELICGYEEGEEDEYGEEHSHDYNCYDAYYVYGCDIEEHIHRRSCYEPPEELPGEIAEPVELSDLTEKDANPSEPLLRRSALMNSTLGLLKGAPLKASPDAQEPVSADDVTLEKATIRWLSSSTGESSPAKFDDLVLAPDSEILPNMQFQIDFSITARQPHEEGCIEVVFPASILKTRDGKEAGVLTLSVPEAPGTTGDWEWTRIGDNIVITNTQPLPPSVKVMIQCTWRNYERGGEQINTASHEIENGTVSDPLAAVVSVLTSEGSELSLSSNEIGSRVKTSISASEASKSAYNSKSKDYYVYDTVAKARTARVPESFLPADPDDYYYVRWYVSGKIRGSQPFTMTLEDEAADGYGAVILGVQDALDGDIKSADGSSVSAVLVRDGYAGDKVAVSAYVWTAYPKSEFAGVNTLVSLENTAVIKVVGYDDGEETQVSARATVLFKPPTLYTIQKIWDDNDDSKGHRPGYVFFEIYRSDLSGNSFDFWTTRSATEASGWKIEFSDNGNPYTYRVKEVTTSANLSGVDGTRWDSHGNEWDLKWRYTLVNQDYDRETSTYSFTNKYSEGWVVTEAISLSKSNKGFTVSKLKDANDSALNDLYNKEQEVIIPFTINAHGDLHNHFKHDGTVARVEVIDSEYTMQRYGMAPGDAEFARVSLSAYDLYHFGDIITGDDASIGLYDKEKLTETPDVHILGQVGSEWIEYAVVSDLVPTPSNGARASGRVITLPEGVTAIKAYLDTDEDEVYLTLNADLRLKPTEGIKGFIERLFSASDYVMEVLTNRARIRIYDASGNIVAQTSGPSNAYLHGRVARSAVYMSKEFFATDNDIAAKRLKTRVVLQAVEQSNIQNVSDYLDSKQLGLVPVVEAGTFYDLLPLGMYPDIESLSLAPNGEVVSFEIKENYLGTGRILLVVKGSFGSHDDLVELEEGDFGYDDTNFPQAGYRSTQTLSFDVYYPWEEAVSYGLDNIYNSAAFIADTDVFGNLAGWMGEDNDASGMKNKTTLGALKEDAAYMTGLDTDSTYSGNTVYAGSRLYSDEVDMTSTAALQKHVMADGGAKWVTGKNGEVSMHEGGKYSYRVTITNEADSFSKNIIMVDALEAYVPGPSDRDYGDRQWKGVLQDVDLAELEALGVEPVVYYALGDIDAAALDPARSGVSLGEVISGSGWTSVKPADLSAVKAIAIDCRNGDGGEFTLGPGEALIFYVYMRAPEGKAFMDALAAEDYDDPANNAHAYNVAYLDADQIGELGSENHVYLSCGYTKVGVYQEKLTVEKVWDDDDDRDGIRVDSVTMKLFANGVYTGNEFTLDESNDFTQIVEHINIIGRDGNKVSFSMEEQPVDGYTVSCKLEGKTLKVINTHVPDTISIPVTKLWENDDLDNGMIVRPSSITVQLLADGVFEGRSITVRAAEDGSWSGEFKDVPKYRDGGTEIVYAIREENVEDYAASYEGFTITNSYHPMGDLKLTKKLVNATEEASSKKFDFVVSLRDKDNYELTDSYEYEMSDGRTGFIRNGRTVSLGDEEWILIKELPSGTRYSFTEKQLPGFLLTSQRLSGTVVHNTTTEALATNIYQTSGTLSIPAKKIVEGRELKSYQFVFRLEDGEGTTIKTAGNKTDGSVHFAAITYTNIDDGKTFTYKLSEIDQARPGYTYDDSVYTVKVTPRDLGDGTMDISVSFEDENGDSAPEAVFTNVYKAEGDLSIKAWKTLTGGPLVDGQFSFELRGADSAVVDTKRNDADGTIVFDPIHFTQDDIGRVLYYEVKEVIGSDDTVIYDRSSVWYEITVVDNGDGTLSFAQRLGSFAEGVFAADPEMLPVFRNVYKDGSLVVQKFIDNPDEANPSEQFKFKVKINAPDPENINIGGFSDADDTKNKSYPMLAPGRKAWAMQGNPGTQFWQRIQSRRIKHIIFTDDYIPTGNEDLSYAVDSNWNGDIMLYCTPGSDTLIICGNGSGGITLNPDCEQMFRQFSTIETVEFDLDVDASKVTSMFAMFHSCSNLKSITGISGWDTRNVMSMRHMFADCYNLKDLDISDWNVRSLIDTNSMFFNCRSLENIDLSNWDTRDLVDASWMFYTSSGPVPSATKTIDLSGWDTRSLEVTNTMFSGRRQLTNIYVGLDWDMSNVTESDNMFVNCILLPNYDAAIYDVRAAYVGEGGYLSYRSSGASLDAPGWRGIFAGAGMGLVSLAEKAGLIDYAYGLTIRSGTVDGVRWTLNDSGVLVIGSGSPVGFSLTTANRAWPWAEYADRIVAVRFDGKVTGGGNMSSMFAGLYNLEKIDLYNFVLDKYLDVDLSSMFSGCEKLTTIRWSGFDTSGTTNMKDMFKGCRALSSVDLSGFKTENVTDMSGMFSGCEALQTLDLTSWDVGNVTDMSSMFGNCEGLTTLDLTGWDTGSVQDMSGMFSGCLELEHIYVSEAWRCAAFADGMFTGDTVLHNFSIDQLDDGTHAVIDDGTNDGYLEMYATFRVEFAAGGTDVEGNMPVALLHVDRDSEIPANSFVKPHYSFKHWSGSDGNTYKDGAIIPAGSFENGQTLMLTAVFEQKEVEDQGGGEYEFYLAGGESVSFENIPAGTTYSVYEETPEGWRLLASNGEKGRIRPVEPTYANFTNRYEPGTVFAQVMAYKTLDGNAPEGSAFSFELVQGNTVVATAVNVDGVISFAPLEYVYDFTETYPLTHRYVIREVAGSDTGILYDTTLHSVAVTLEEEGVGKLVRTIRYDDADEVPTFINFTKKSSLEITKNAEGLSEENKDSEFTFRIAFEKGNGSPLDDAALRCSIDRGSSSETLGSDIIESAGSYLISIKAGEKIVIGDIPGGTVYKIEEIDIPDGWSLKSSTGAEGTTTAGETHSAVFTNKYSAPGYAKITAHKRLIGANGAIDTTLAEGEFAFTLTDDEGTVISTKRNGALDSSATTMDDAGSEIQNPWKDTAPVELGTVTIPGPGTYKYYIKELDEGGNFSYDSHTEEVTIIATDRGNGTLNISTVYSSGSEALFTNTVKSGSLSLTKTIKNATEGAKDTSFSFVISLADANGMALEGMFHGKLNGTDDVSFTVTEGVSEAIKIKGGDIFTFVDLPRDARYSISELETKGWTMTSSENVSGVLRAGLSAETAVFENTYHVEGSITLEAEKRLMGETLEAGLFRFGLYDEAGELIYTAASDAEGKIVFDPIDYDYTADGKTFRYLIREIGGEDYHYTYDDAEYYALVTPKENGAGGYDFTVVYGKTGEEGAAEPVFTNYRNFDFTVKKDVKGIMGDRENPFAFTITLDDSTAVGEKRTSYAVVKDGSVLGLIKPGESFAFSIADGESITVQGVPLGMKYSVEESPVGDYTVSVRLTDRTGGLVSETEGTKAEGSVDDDLTAVYVNYYPAFRLPDTGGRGLASVAAIALSLAAVSFVFRKKREEEEV